MDLGLFWGNMGTLKCRVPVLPHSDLVLFWPLALISRIKYADGQRISVNLDIQIVYKTLNFWK